MEVIFGILIFAAFVALIIGLVNPSLIMRWSAKPTRWKVFGWFLLVFFVWFILFAIFCVDSFSYEAEEEQKPIEQTNQGFSQTIDGLDVQKKKIAEEIKTWGAKDAYFDENNYFVYCVDPSDISAPADEVAKEMFPMVKEVPGVKGCIVLDFNTKKRLGKYTVQ